MNDMNWKPIQTVPKDGTTVLVYFTSYGAVTVRWCDEDGNPNGRWATWHVDDYKHGPYAMRVASFYATHWMPLPEPPKDPEGGLD